MANKLIWFGVGLFFVSFFLGLTEVAMIAVAMTGIVVIVEDIIHERKSK